MVRSIGPDWSTGATAGWIGSGHPADGLPVLRPAASRRGAFPGSWADRFGAAGQPGYPHPQGLAPDNWQAEFKRIEEAWLAGRKVGDAHEAINFLHLLSDLHFDDVAPSDILAAFDRFRARAGGERFSYCPLHGAVHLVRMKKPSLDNGLVLVRYRELARLPPCKGLDDCPGVGYGVSEILSRSRA